MEEDEKGKSVMGIIEETIVEEAVTPMPRQEDSTQSADLPNDFIDEVRQESQNCNSQLPNPETSARMLQSNEEVADELRNRNRLTDINLKRIYGFGILGILVLWVLFVIIFSFIQLNPCECRIHHVSDTVFITLLTSATANILALPAIILKYLFPHKP